MDKMLKSHWDKTIELITGDTDKSIVSHFKDSYDKVVPVFPVSSVSGEGITCVREFITGLEPRNSFDTSPNYPVNFVIESSYLIHGIGIVVSGFLQSGVIKVGDHLSLGPYYGKFYKIVIKSIHNNFRESINEVYGGNSGCINFKFINPKETLKRNSIKNGVKILSQPKLYYEFICKIKLLHHHTTIRTGYQPVIHIGNISQACIILEMNKDTLRLYEDSIVKFRFRYHPEYLEKGMQVLFREGKTKGAGEITEIFQYLKN